MKYNCFAWSKVLQNVFLNNLESIASTEYLKNIESSSTGRQDTNVHEQVPSTSRGSHSENTNAQSRSQFAEHTVLSSISNNTGGNVGCLKSSETHSRDLSSATEGAHHPIGRPLTAQSDPLINPQPTQRSNEMCDDEQLNEGVVAATAQLRFNLLTRDLVVKGNLGSGNDSFTATGPNTFVSTQSHSNSRHTSPVTIGGNYIEKNYNQITFKHCSFDGPVVCGGEGDPSEPARQ